MSGRLLAMRLLLGAIMTLTALNYFLGLVPLLQLSDPLAAQLVTAFDHSGLLAVAQTMMLVGGLLLLAGKFVPFALALLMPLCTCILYIAVLLEGDPLLGLLALVMFGLNGLLMLAHLPYYREMLRSGALAEGETPDATYGELYVNPLTAVPPRHIAMAVLVLLAAIAFFNWIVPYANGDMGLLVLIFPTLVLIAGIVRGSMHRSRRTL